MIKSMKLNKTMVRLLSELFGSRTGNVTKHPLEKTVVTKDSLEHRAALVLEGSGIVVISPAGNAHLTVERAVK